MTTPTIPYYPITHDDGLDIVDALDAIKNAISADPVWGSIIGTLSDQTDLQNALNAKAPLASPALTGTPTAPTPPTSDSSTKIATTAFVNAVVNASSSTLYVDKATGSDSTGDGTQSHPYKTIQKAIDVAPLSPTTIMIVANTYSEELSISGKKIILRCTTSSGITISTSNTAITVDNGGVLILRGVFTIDGTRTGIAVKNSSAVIYEALQITDVLNIASGSSSISGCGIMARGGSVFCAYHSESVNIHSDVYIEIRQNSSSCSAIAAFSGSVISLNNLEVDLDSSDYVLSSENSTILIGELSGDYQNIRSVYSTDPVSMIFIGNFPDESNYYTKAAVDAKFGREIMYFTSQTVSVASNAQIMRIPASGTNSSITTDTVVLECTFAVPANITSNVSWQSYDGYITFTGTCTAATTANVTLGTKGN